MIRKAAITLAVATATVSATAIDKRIIGGEWAKDGDFPFILPIALHFAYYVRAGTHEISKPAVVGEVAFVKQHPEYNGYSQWGATHFHDIAIVKLSTPIAESDKIKYVTLPENGSDPVVDSNAVAAGFGEQVVRGHDPDHVDKLRKVVIPIRARKTCTSKAPVNQDTKICAGGDGKGLGNRDSGSPLIDQETGRLIGITSQAFEEAKGPTTFTRVARYIPFIEEYLGSVSNPDPNAPSRTEAYEAEIKAGRLWNQQVEDYCAKTGIYYADCRNEVQKCNGLRKPDGKMDEVDQCFDKKLDELKKWYKEKGWVQ